MNSYLLCIFLLMIMIFFVKNSKIQSNKFKNNSDIVMGRNIYKDTVYMLETGRLGNRIAELSFCILVARKLGLEKIKMSHNIFELKKNEIIIIEKNKNLNNYLDDVFKNNKDNYALLYLKGRQYNLPHSILIHKDLEHLRYLKKLLFGNTVFEENTKYDIAVHLRFGDIAYKIHPSYKVVPINFITNSISKCYKTNGKTLRFVIIGCFESFQDKKRLLRYVNKIKKLKCIQHLDVISNSIYSDFTTLMTVPRLIMSPSTFSYWAALFNENLKELYVPYFGITSNHDIDTRKWPNNGTKVIIQNI